MPKKDETPAGRRKLDDPVEVPRWSLGKLTEELNTVAEKAVLTDGAGFK